MKIFRLIAIVPSLLIAAAFMEPLNAAPAALTAPSIETHRIEAQNVCHHYRWSSRRACTSARTLMFVARPPLYYPHRYFGGTPHYRSGPFYWRTLPWYAHHRWYHGHRWPYRYGWY